MGNYSDSKTDFIRKAKYNLQITEHLFKQLPISLTGVFINLLLLSFFLKDEVPSRILIPWTVVTTATLCLRFLLYAAYKEKWIKSVSTFGWLAAFLVGICATGAAFGSIGLFGVVHASLPYRIFIYFVLGGMAAASVGAYPIKPSAAYLNSVPLFIPITVHFFFLSQQVYLSMAIMGTAFYFIMIFTLQRTTRNSLQLYKLVEENRELSTSLQNINNELVREVEERKDAKKELYKHYSQLKALFDLSPYAIFVETPKGEILDCNTKAVALTGYTKEELQLLGVKAIIPAQTDEDLERMLLDEHLSRDGFIESYNKRKNGEVFPVEISMKEISVGDMNVVLVVLRDITARREAQDRIKIFSWAVEQSPASVIITDINGYIQYVNPKFSRITGYSFDDAIGKNPRFLNAGRQSKEHYEKLWRTIKEGREWHGELCNISKSGEEFWESASIAPIHDANDDIINFVAVKEDITEKKNQQERIEHLALYDALTNLPNRNLLIDHLRNSLHQADRNKTSTAVLYMDLNGFKPINDEYGHDYGDEVLKIVAGRLQEASRRSDIAARIGGDEFVIVAKEINDNNTVKILAERVITAVERPISFNGISVQIGLSIGISLYPYNGSTIEELLRKADLAMYSAKTSPSRQFAFA